jgi:DMSO/TMAO reductase YedYZ molybdopterin-dependent catalytic subunit
MSEPREYRIGRAAFLSVLGVGGAGILFGNRIAGTLGSPLARAGSVLPSAVQNVAGELIPSGWRIYAINPPWPEFHPASYTLRVDGLVRRPVTLRWARFAGLPSAGQTTDFHCVTGWTVGGVHWRGVRLQTLWDMVEPLPEARYANFVSMERDYVDTLSMKQTTLPGVMLAHTMNGQPLPREHGAPLRLVIPEMYGYKNVKWLRRITLTRDLHPGYWEQNGYDVDAWVGNSNGY